MSAADELAHAVVLDAWGEEPCGVITDAIHAVLQPRHRRKLLNALAEAGVPLLANDHAARRVLAVARSWARYPTSDNQIDLRKAVEMMDKGHVGSVYVLPEDQ